jgi:acetyl-CoA acyltransferase
MTRNDAVIVDVTRTASGRGKLGGALSTVHPSDLLAVVLQDLLARNDVDPQLVDDVIAGCVSQAGEQAANVARTAVLSAGFPESVPGTTVDRQCGSSQQAVHFAAQGVIAGAYDVVIACGVESMSRVPMGSASMDRTPAGARFDHRYPSGMVPQGAAAEMIAARWSLDRDELDEYAARSHARASHAAENGLLAAEITPVPVTGQDGCVTVHSRDETIRPSTTAQSLATLPAAFQTRELSQRFPEIGWSITAGNSSPLTDGASAALIMSEDRASALGLRPRARFRSFAVVGDDPQLMLTAPIPATRKVLAAAGLSLSDIDVFEINEAFASVPLAWARELDADAERLNPRGGAIALGHALGASGTRLLTTMLHTLETTGGRYGLQSMCEGGGMANAMIIERL